MMTLPSEQHKAAVRQPARHLSGKEEKFNAEDRTNKTKQHPKSADNKPVKKKPAINLLVRELKMSKAIQTDPLKGNLFNDNPFDDPKLPETKTKKYDIDKLFTKPVENTKQIEINGLLDNLEILIGDTQASYPPEPSVSQESNVYATKSDQLIKTNEENPSNSSDPKCLSVILSEDDLAPPKQQQQQKKPKFTKTKSLSNVTDDKSSNSSKVSKAEMTLLQKQKALEKWRKMGRRRNECERRHREKRLKKLFKY